MRCPTFEADVLEDFDQKVQSVPPYVGSLMPDMNGKNLTKTLTERFPDIKCLFMAGYTANVITNHGVLDSGVYFINEPFSKQNLAKKVQNILNSSKKS